MTNGSPASPRCTQKSTLCSGIMSEERYVGLALFEFLIALPRERLLWFRTLGSICFLFRNFLMRGLRFASRRAVRVFWIPEEIWFAGLHLAIGFSWLTSLELLLPLLIACWLILLLICGSGIGDLDI